jgi:phytanoyl-CoA hydroxylase
MNIIVEKKLTHDPTEVPWFDQPNAASQLEHRRVSDALCERDFNLLSQWVTHGFCIVPNLVEHSLIDRMQRDLDEIWTSETPVHGLVIQDLKKSGGGAHIALSHAEITTLTEQERVRMRDGSNWRVPRFHDFSSAARAVATHDELLRLVILILGCYAPPTYTLNFVRGSEQPLHQDTAAFHVMPPNFLVGAWIACEDISPLAGPLAFYPKSHREPLFSKFDNYPQTNFRTARRGVMDDYKAHVIELSKSYERCLFIARKGDVIFLHGMTIHGGSKIINPLLTRRSYVIHFIPPQMNMESQVTGPFNW